MKEILLEAKNVHVHYGGVKALDGVSVAVGEGEILALMGPNGAGKSSVLKAIFGLAPLQSGNVFWHGQKVDPIAHEMVERGISFVPQGRRVFRHLTILENLELGGITVKNKKDLHERIAEALEIFPALKAKLRHKSGSLSGGQQQMLALARGLITRPQVLLLDEPSLGLAPKIVGEVFAKIKEINERHKIAIVVVEHNIKTLLHIVNRIYILDKGKVVTEGTPEILKGNRILEDVFLGKLV
ncbi:MAG: ABC transporter ATP-binding protein [Candidatus Pacebacteria bacterium]|nr:ABC transporter ATP-binding protein [Candidatus Paceibacterota bacterium]MDD5357230.1 ABC transporter ATP-binding protein [Candidatus Paceibacterota bacterium]